MELMESAKAWECVVEVEVLLMESVKEGEPAVECTR